MPNMFYIGLSGMNVAQGSLMATAHNSANSATQGYSRQYAVIGANGGNYVPSVGYFGNGAKISGMVRSYDNFISGELNQAIGKAEFLNAHFTGVSQIDTLLGGITVGPKLAASLEGFFNSMQGVANNPADPSARQQLLSSAQALANKYRSANGELNNMNLGVNDQITASVDQINLLSRQIADMNKQILQASAGGQQPNDLMDQRDLMAHNLSGLVQAKVNIGSDGRYNITTGNGMSLVSGDAAKQFKAVPSAADPSRMAVALVNQNGSESELSDSTFTGGSLGGVLQYRNESLIPSQNALGRIAIALADAINSQQKLGVDMKGQFGTDFFSQSSPGALSNDKNKGNMSLTPKFSDVSKLTGSDYKITVSGTPGSLEYIVTRLPGNGVMGNYNDADFPLKFDGLTIDAAGLGQPGDSFLIQPTRNGASGLNVLIADPEKVAAGGALVTNTVASNTGTGKISTAEINKPYMGNPLTGPVTLVFDNVTGTFSGFPTGSGAPSNMDITVTTADGSSTVYPAGSDVPYTSGATMSFGGITVSVSGEPKAGDQFTIEPNINGISDGRNALAMGALQNTKTMDGGTASFSDAYGKLVGKVASKTQELSMAATSQGQLAQNILERLQSISGVNQDEETANVLIYQQMYQANAKVLKTANEMFDTILGIN
ncbi:flagellar hook-associated protein FlgK [Glaciimonas soli]|uniref:Flagellar hook-associated protein 1 n=1 Tax=Glaciimonas soli TaxID=2590999 RepID=A0A843YN95_9BURK|nr:flagellar hook-associated protein FlgK [Glaciimonas soli]MQQ99456.1 flagellar hook-associated protein FlgK [Glaciimonas soli]